MSRVPRIRFKGFEEDWEQRKLGEIFKYEQPQPYIVKCTEYDDINEIPVLTAGQSFILGYTDEEFGIKEVSDENPLIIFDDFTTSSHYVNFSFKVKSSAIKLLTLNTKKDNINCAFNALQGITYVPISHERHWISIFSSFDVLLPKSNDEQELIGGFLKSLDHLITLHQRKLQKLKIIKKSMLENLFPQNGEKTPKIRFSGFTKDWEQRKVNEIIEDYIEKTTIQNQYTVLTSSQQKGIVYQEEYFSDRQVTTNENIGYYVLPRGYFTYRSRSDTNVFVFNRNDIIDKGIISYYYPVFFNKNSDSDFLLRRLNTGIERQITMAAEGTGQHVLAHSKFKNMDIFVPYLDEQKSIGKYFESLDHLITLHQSKLDKLQKLKKSMLESMFV